MTGSGLAVLTRGHNVKRAISAVVAFVCIAGVGGATAVDSSGASATPLGTFGYSVANLVSKTPDQQNAYLDFTASMVGQGGTVRTTINWDPARRSQPDFTRVDALVSATYAHGLLLLPNIHLNKASGVYVNPGTAPGGWPAWQAGVQSIAARYGPGGSYAKAHPGFPGITRYEIWNEPDSPTGSAGGTINPATADNILKYGSLGIRAAAASNWQPDIIAFGLAYTKFAYLTSLYSADPNVESYMTTLGIHLYMSKNPATCLAATTNPHCVRSLPLLRSWLDSHEAPGQVTSVGIASTEGGYSGSNATCVPPNVVTTATQASWGQEAVDWIRANPSVGMTFFSPFGLYEGPTQTYACGSGYNYLYWQDH